MIFLNFSPFSDLSILSCRQKKNTKKSHLRSESVAATLASSQKRYFTGRCSDVGKTSHQFDPIDKKNKESSISQDNASCIQRMINDLEGFF